MSKHSFLGVHDEKEVTTLPRLLQSCIAHFPTATVNVFPENRKLSFVELGEMSASMASFLHDKSLKLEETVGTFLPTTIEHLAALWGISGAGGAIAPFAVPTGVVTGEYLPRLQHILDNARITKVITSSDLADKVGLSQLDIEVYTPEMMLECDSKFPEITIPAESLAILQYTSGSTSQPKGVMLSHSQVLAGISALTNAMDFTSSDIGCHWLPLSHDMGLISTLLTIASGADLHVSTPSTFIRRPAKWLKYFSEIKGTIYSGPNFSYRYLMDAVSSEELSSYDLSNTRIMVNGSEPIDPKTLNKFIEHFSLAKLKPEAIWPSYGMAEATLGVTMPEHGQTPRYQWIDRDLLADRAIAVETDKPEKARGVTCLGKPIPGVQMRIVKDNENRKVCAEGEVGEIELNGPSMCGGYYLDQKATDSLIVNDWLRTGDLAYVSGGELYIVGRKKDMIIINGTNYYPEDIEALVAHTPGISNRHCVAVPLYGYEKSDEATDSVVLLAETRLKKDELIHLADRLNSQIKQHFSIDAIDVLLVKPNTLHRTTSGKFRRHKMKELLIDNQIELVFDGRESISEIEKELSV